MADFEDTTTTAVSTDRFTRSLPTVADLKAKLKPVNLPTYRLVLEVMMDCFEEIESLLEAGWSEDAVEGSLDADDFTAAVMIRSHARENPDRFPHVASMTVARVKMGMKRAMSETGIARWQRRVEA